MGILWLTYAWDDNQDHDVDFVAQELVRGGVPVKLDRWNIVAGRRLWDQIATFITDPSQSDAWAIYATQKSLASERCREELAYALDRALNQRGDALPVIALFPSTVERDLIPTSIRTRLYISLADPEWKERMVAAVEHRAPAIGAPDFLPYVITTHSAPHPYMTVIEVRPRAGTWYPLAAAVPVAEKDRVGMALRTGPRGQVPAIHGIVFSDGSGTSEDGEWYFELGGHEATPTRSHYLFFKEMPTRFGFGQPNSKDQMYVWPVPGT